MQPSNVPHSSTMDNAIVSFSDEEEEEVFDDEDEDDDENDTSFWEDLSSSWRQHCVACLVAVLATALAYLYQQHQRFIVASVASSNSGIAPKQAGRLLYEPQPTTLNLIRNQIDDLHPLLHHYHRTANISFCGEASRAIPDTQHTQQQQLAVMDFDVPHRLISTMKLHFSSSNGGSPTLESETNSDDTVVHSQQHVELACLERLRASSPHKANIKGVSLVYKSPLIESMYRGATTTTTSVASSSASKPLTQSNVQAAVLTFTGFAAKFVNMDVSPVLLYWDGRGGDAKNRRLIGEIAPFEALSTATRPGQSFSVSPVYDHSHALDRWVATEDDAVQYYEPAPKRALTDVEQMLFDRQKLNQEFAKHYLIHSRRTWLSHFPRAFPLHPMWPAHYFGQQHMVTTSDPATSYTLEVASVTPRVFTIPNFLSAAECDALLALAHTHQFEASTVYAGGDSNEEIASQTDPSTRSSSNTWLARDSAALTDTIYRRAAHVTQLDEALLQAPFKADDAKVDWPAHHHPMAESLQVIRYQAGEEYAPHHDWVIPSQQHPYQPTRFATLLLYLNDDYKGGRTTFPRAVNAHYHEGITIQPKKGTAILFYNVLPDGNVDDLSIHGSEKVTDGVKYAANLWLWEPVIN